MQANYDEAAVNSAIDDFDSDGVALIENALSEQWIERLRTACEEILNNLSERGGKLTRKDEEGNFIGDLWMWRRNETFRALAFDSPLPHIARAIMKTKKVNVVWDQLLVKEPNTPKETPWHQDQPYAWLDGFQNCSFWIPLDPVSEETGALQFVRKSHRGPWYQPVAFDPNKSWDGNEFEPLPDIQADRAAYPIIWWDMKPGDVVVHHQNILHYAPGNRTANRRRAVAVRYAGDDATYAVRKIGPAPLFDPGLKVGDPLDSDLFPVVFR